MLLLNDEQLLEHVGAVVGDEVFNGFWDTLDYFPQFKQSSWARQVNNWAISFELPVRLLCDSLVSVEPSTGRCVWKVYSIDEVIKQANI